MINALKHTAVCITSLFLLIGLPFMLSGGFGKLSPQTDAVSSASAVIDAPSGKFTVMINRDRHKSEGDLSAWREFFSGGESAVIFDDIVCVTLSGDMGALEMAQSFMSRLPENQMKVSSEDAVFALSKAEHGRFDVMIVSEEAAQMYGIGSVYGGKNVDVIHIEDITV